MIERHYMKVVGFVASKEKKLWFCSNCCPSEVGFCPGTKTHPAKSVRVKPWSYSGSPSAAVIVSSDHNHSEQWHQIRVMSEVPGSPLE